MSSALDEALARFAAAAGHDGAAAFASGTSLMCAGRVAEAAPMFQVADALLRAFPCVDAVVRGEGEDTAVELMTRLRAAVLKKFSSHEVFATVDMLRRFPRLFQLERAT